ncbi:hypothetical protein A3C23_04405 [Candidatus Roizmanbacteria bacterium RIFCSPHIGHO2_02_FULL_37_13b]|uniref:TrbC/VIRB2 family protein n=1 Tax=Candidatus Roizmanbacteria bacterium RIFCSPLOWO2_02_FULL_36_11 TaxID=1802071 RepID=A0A1F7JH52_9BACT|nr:MAG: hypothetical protein A3C23_04405 [Candidatus Roizmanbacteria bacterium RIFCSPHIGHO2_02_FULL_37_13b]OGK54951.1 MAG: hypothetical protein A3H78_00550 [Candidatus Roizmanbacteria bacterium RIFCSPLOWO2_02_FULL_36_11]
MIVYAQIKEWGDCVVDGVPTLKCLEVVFSNLLTMASALVIVILFIMMAVGALKYLTSAGDPEKLKGAQGTIKYALFGLGLFIASFIIIKTIDILFLGGQGKLFEFTIPVITPEP